MGGTFCTRSIFIVVGFPLDLENPFGAIGEVFWEKSARMGTGRQDSLFCCFRHIHAHTVRVWLPNQSHTGVNDGKI